MLQQYVEQALAYQKKFASYASKNYQQSLEQAEKFSKNLLDAMPIANEQYKKELLEMRAYSLESSKEIGRIFENAMTQVDSPETYGKAAMKLVEEMTKLYVDGSSKVQAQVLDSVEKTKANFPKEFGSYFDAYADAIKNGANTVAKSVNENIELANKAVDTATAKKASK